MKKLIAVLLMTACVLSVCSCWRKKQPTTTSATESGAETDDTAPDSTGWFNPFETNASTEFSTYGPNYTGTFVKETTVPTGGDSTPHKYYSADDIMKILEDCANVRTGDTYSVYCSRTDKYRENSPGQTPVMYIAFETPGIRVPMRPDETFQITEGSYVEVQMILYDYDVVVEVYNKVVEYYKQTTGSVVENSQDVSARGTLIMCATTPNSSSWGNTCYVLVEDYLRDRFGKDAYYVTVRMPIPVS